MNDDVVGGDVSQDGCEGKETDYTSCNHYMTFV